MKATTQPQHIRAWISTAYTVAGMVLAIAAFLASICVAQYQIGELRTDVDGVESQQATDHDQLTEIRNDVRWIRDTMTAGRE